MKKVTSIYLDPAIYDKYRTELKKTGVSVSFALEKIMTAELEKIKQAKKNAG